VKDSCACGYTIWRTLKATPEHASFEDKVELKGQANNDKCMLRLKSQLQKLYFFDRSDEF